MTRALRTTDASFSSHGMVTVSSPPRQPEFLTVSGLSRVVVIDHEGPRLVGSFAQLGADRLRALDVWLDSRDAVHEDADGRLPTMSASRRNEPS
jgi:hypothetical protein